MFQSSNANDLKFWAFVNIFHWNSWLSLIIIIFCIAMGYIMIRKLEIDNFHAKDDPETFGFLNAISLNILIVVQKDYSITKESLSTRILFLTFCISSFVLFSFYTADLTSLMTSGSAPSPLRSFKDVYDNGYDILMLGESFVATAVL